MIATILVDEPPTWLPERLERVWDLLATYPLVLALVIVLVGVVLAILARAFMLFWGLKVTSRTKTTVDDKLIRLTAGVVALIIVYTSLVAAVQALPLGVMATTVLTRLLLSLLVIFLMRAALRAAHIMLIVLSGIRERFAFVEERTIPLFEISLTILIVAIAGYMLLGIWHIDATA
jgi:MscS family membrane protein